MAVQMAEARAPDIRSSPSNPCVQPVLLVSQVTWVVEDDPGDFGAREEPALSLRSILMRALVSACTGELRV